MNMNILKKISTSILITGETGTGKTSLAKKIHEISDRVRHNFVSVNLTGLSDELFLSELFGHRKGSFTGAIYDKPGYCDQVGEGTLFLDEVGDLTVIQQKYLLRLLDEKKFRSVGSLKDKSFKGTIIMATHRNLSKMVAAGSFRQDLYFRIRVFTVELPAVRECPYGLQKAIEEQILQYNKKSKQHKILKESTLRILLNYNWPGNYREINNTMEFIFHNSTQHEIGPEDLPEWVVETTNEVVGEGFHSVTQNFEKQYLIKQLIINNGRLNETSLKTGLNKGTLISKIKKYAIDLEYIKLINRSIINMRSAS